MRSVNYSSSLSRAVFFPQKCQHKQMHIAKFRVVADTSRTSRTSEKAWYLDRGSPDAVSSLEGQEIWIEIFFIDRDIAEKIILSSCGPQEA